MQTEKRLLPMKKTSTSTRILDWRIDRVPLSRLPCSAIVTSRLTVHCCRDRRAARFRGLLPTTLAATLLVVRLLVALAVAVTLLAVLTSPMAPLTGVAAAAAVPCRMLDQ